MFFVLFVFQLFEFLGFERFELIESVLQKRKKIVAATLNMTDIDPRDAREYITDIL